ncbi:MAG: cysteine desulfurase [Verrucomicrobiota bacterium]|jgi:SufS family cysteine desulfurase
MSITGNDEAAAPPVESAPDDSAHSRLIKKLLAEAFSESARGAGPAAAPAPPSEIPAVSILPDISGTDAVSALPPVHPKAQPASPIPEKPPEKTPSGGHAPESGDTYAFGEPRCSGDYLLNSKKASPEATNKNPLLGSPNAESLATPEYYFLRGSDVSGQSPLAYQSHPQTTPPIPKFDIEGVRRDFPALHQLVNGRPLIWLDNAATTHKPQAVIDATSQFYGRDNSNIHRAAHTLATRSTELFEAGREKVRKFLGAADAKEIVFVRGTTEAINLVAQSYGRKNIGAGDEIIVSELEHHANIVPWQLLAEQVGASLRVIPINDRGELILEEFVKLLGAKTRFVSVAHVSNSLGTVNPVEQIIALAHARGVPVLVDGAQSTPHLPVNVSALDADFYVFSGHKVFAPTGIGALYGKAPLLEAMPPWQGGGHMIKDVRFEKTTYQHAPEKFEAGTPDIAGVVGLGAAIDYLFKVGIPGIAGYEHTLLEYATQTLGTVPGLRPIGTAAAKASVLAFVIPGVPNDTIARHLDKHGIAVRAGHHCALPAIRHFGLESSVRPSLAFYNTREEVDALVLALRSLRRN